MTEKDLQNYICLLSLPGIGNVTAKTLISYCGSVEGVLNASQKSLLKIPGIGQTSATAILQHQQYMPKAEAEVAFIHKNNIEPISYLSPTYPRLLKECSDSPILLYYKGNTPLDFPKMIAVVGTRNISDYGKERCVDLIEGLKKYDVLVISGLAYGVDYFTHMACVQQQVPTIGVLGHGLDRIYPSAHRDLAKRMVQNGGLLTEFPSGGLPAAENFPRRNRIIAGMTQCTIVVETSAQGGSIITARAAASYNRDVFAVPGRVGDPVSIGCNWLIKKNTAAMLETVADLVDYYGWESNKGTSIKRQTQLPLDLSPEESQILTFLREKRTAHIDVICYYTGLAHSSVSPNLLTLEFRGITQALPGSMYKLLIDY